MRRVAMATLCALILVALVAPSVGADIYRRVAKDGTVYFTNIRPHRGGSPGAWKKVIRERAPAGKGAARRGNCAGCDVVPAHDRSRDRFHRFDAFIAEASLLYHIPEPLIRAVIKVESDYDPRVVSSAGARGLMQLMPSVIADMQVSDPHNPRQGILGGTRLLRLLANRYEGDIVKTIAAYHCGPGNLAKYSDNVPPYRNTRRYLRRVLDYYYHYKQQNQIAAAAQP
ncbi:MAG TPA: lytic transglycosylase domain-containing protein [Kofleriaceae bacterium]|nr:lytic transglycosylase domain-containing protein [Kofleriaceae bacterium]